MKARGILMHGRSVQNLFVGRKTQTRRILKESHVFAGGHDYTGRSGTWSFGFNPFTGSEAHGVVCRCPYGAPGDLLYVREAWRTREKLDQQNATEIANSCINAGFKVGPNPACPIRYESPGLLVRPWGDNDLNEFGPWGRYRHARFMPRWASRLTLHLTDVRVERVQEISEADARDEGITEEEALDIHYGRPFRGAFARLWDDTNGAGAWDRNDWVWALTFEVLHENVDAVLARLAGQGD